VQLLEGVTIGGGHAPNRVLFGPHETNLGKGRALSDRHLAYYRRRLEGGTGMLVTEEASVHPGDWPYERCPLASECGEGWALVAGAAHEHGALALAALGHAGGQGSSAYSQSPLWAPSRVPEVNSREVPKWMEAEDVEAVVQGFASAAAVAAQAGLDGVEINAGQYSLIRQFLSGLTNFRDDEWGTDRLAFASRVLRAVRSSGLIVGLRLSCDELAPWAGLTPPDGAAVAVALAPLVDYLVVVKGSIFSVSATRPDTHVPPGFNIDLCRSVRQSVRDAGFEIPVFLQGSVVDVAQAESSLTSGVCDGVEMTRAQIADPDLVAKVRAGHVERVRPCILCNQACQVRDARNPIVSCVVEPSAGHETSDLPIDSPFGASSVGSVRGVVRDVVIVGGGPAGLEAARVAASRGHRVRLFERDRSLGGSLRIAATAAGRQRLQAFIEWLIAECRRLGVTITTDSEVGASELADFDSAVILLCTGSTDGARDYSIKGGSVFSAREWLSQRPVIDGPVAVLDPIGGPIGVSVAETLAASGHVVHLVTQDHIAGNELARTGDLAPANARLQQAGVVIERRSIPRVVSPGSLEVEDRFTAYRRSIAAAAVVDAGFRLPDIALWEATGLARAGDAVAPRSLYEAVLEARRAVLALEDAGHPPRKAVLA
jgi:mycofactocin system FadH/OYE family oxidoreductase 1